ncbi:MAG: VanW family protein, partial [Candidatus Magasanikbacteria bacterium]|nr:VanW family protein [Candidatus Magasanikbacteria bacterium]
MRTWINKLRTKSSWITRAWLIFIICFVVLGLISMILISYANSYTGRVFPGVHIGEVPIGGMSEEEVTRYLQDMNDRLISEGWEFTVDAPQGQETFTILPVYVSGSNSVELMTIDVESEVAVLLRTGKEGHVFARAFAALRHRISQPQIALSHITADVERIEESLSIRLEPLETLAQPATLDITLEPFTYTIVSSSPGIAFDTSNVIDTLKDSWKTLKTPHVQIAAIVDEPSALEEEFVPILDRLETVMGHGDLLLSYTEPITSIERTWRITRQNMVDWLTVSDLEDDEQGAAFSLSIASTTLFLEEQVAPVVNVEPRNAKFEVSDTGRVTMFQASRPGVEIASEETLLAINEAFMQRTWFDEGITKNVKVQTQQAEPEFATGEANDLGITEVLGIGVSKFGGSPRNRRLNINEGGARLNGILVPPGEEFSTIAHTQPYTEESGYLPELVIKGDEVKPEIGGGLCQIGSTLFRMAMNSGMEITQRRNHSLVVSYYNDLTNGLPGTDATIYDPAPDFRFKNDTGH